MTTQIPRSRRLHRQRLIRRFQGALIDENGREILITRDMIQEACRRLEQSAQELRFNPHPSQNSRLRVRQVC